MAYYILNVIPCTVFFLSPRLVCKIQNIISTNLIVSQHHNSSIQHLYVINSNKSLNQSFIFKVIFIDSKARGLYRRKLKYGRKEANKWSKVKNKSCPDKWKIKYIKKQHKCRFSVEWPKNNERQYFKMECGENKYITDVVFRTPLLVIHMPTNVLRSICDSKN